MDWLDLAQDRDKLQALWTQQLTLGFHEITVIYWPAEELLASQEGLCSVG